MHACLTDCRQTNPDRAWLLRAEEEDDPRRWRLALLEGQRLLPPTPVSPETSTKPTSFEQSSSPPPVRAAKGPAAATAADTASGVSTLDSSPASSPPLPKPAVSVSNPTGSSISVDPVRDDSPDRPGTADRAAVLTLVKGSPPKRGTAASPAEGVWLLKQAAVVGAARRRFFVVRPGAVDYYADSDCQRAKGSFTLAAATVTVQGEHVTVGAAGRLWQLTASSEGDAAAWAARVRAAVPREELEVAVSPHQGWVQVDGAPFYGVLGADALLRLQEGPGEGLGQGRCFPILRTTLLLLSPARLTIVRLFYFIFLTPNTIP